MDSSRRQVCLVGLLLGSLAFGACKKAAPTQQEPAPDKPTETKPTVTRADLPPGVQLPSDAGPAGCGRLSRAECLASDHCTLELAGSNVYRCRDDEGVCEVGIKQGDRTACTARAECTFDTGTCYCPCVGAARTLTVEEPESGCACACGGGPPAMCVEKAKIAAVCAKLTRAKCLESQTCTLHLVGKGVYECRPDTGACEVNIQQTNQKACEAEKGCAWTAGDGYCPCPGGGKAAVDDEQSGPVGCACGGTGGPPPMCSPKK